MITAKDVYRSQRNLDELKADCYGYGEEPRSELKAQVDQAEIALKAQQAEVGGKVYRVPAANMDRFEKKIAKLNRKAAKLDCQEITFTVKETEEEERTVGENAYGEKIKELLIWNYIVLKGAAPVVPGYRFIAALDHTVQENDGDPVIVKQVPTIEEELDLSAFYYADARCDHCNKIRSRNTTYLVEEIATNKISKVGSSCLSDFTGANDPHRVASYLEYLIELERETNEEGEDYSHGRELRLISNYLTHVAASVRAKGWTPRSYGDNPTADDAWSNIRNYKKFDKQGNPLYVELTEEDEKTALASIEWAKGLEGKSDFDHNLVTMANLKYMPKKGDGIIAYIVQGYVKDETKRKEKEAEKARLAEEHANAEPIRTEDRQVITGRVITEYEKDNGYTIQHKMTILDDRGFKVNGTVPSNIWNVKEGDRVTFTASIKPKDDDKFYGWYKRPTKATIIDA